MFVRLRLVTTKLADGSYIMIDCLTEVSASQASFYDE